METIKLIFKILFLLAKDIYKTFTGLTMCDTLDIIELIGFGLIVNAIYGFMKEPNVLDFVYIIAIAYITLKAKKRKDIKC